MVFPIEELKNWLYILFMGMPRLLALFTVLPMLHKKVLGGTMIRNGICLCMVLFLHPLLSEGNPEEVLSILATGGIVLKEVFIGALLGFCVAIPFWALESSGFFIDNQRGASMASIMNPFSGAETSPLGILFSQAFIAIIMTSGLFLMLLKNVFLSYQAWPVFSYYPEFNFKATIFFLNQFDLIVSLAMWLAAPIIISMFITEFGIALISRSAPQLNVFILAMPIKSAVAAAILVVYVGTVMALTRRHMMDMGSLFTSLGVLWQ
ncbi:MAG: type III secretion system export apparatus subunit SctT [Candidatus Endonucleobacter bathymodioli]|uniref:Type III secretion system export apparatus subunit SctT n=1 Tax=Candidatus Endonucleibacter bathymodioli TaxID=539814 RepID=A0AA90NKY3_9GAMM|nr:type III secretion system export apparatus subunit SctT [Candidatus Endonucleobacter bathymodioli]